MCSLILDLPLLLSDSLVLFNQLRGQPPGSTNRRRSGRSIVRTGSPSCRVDGGW
ncbi:MAG: hypothetical protein NTX31_07710 [Burkholderiales bacterium]|nr:hypothetical protein [Burkholderiales bacterium]